MIDVLQESGSICPGSSRALQGLLNRELKGAQSRYFELFWAHTKLSLNGRKPENNGLIR